MLKEKEKNCLAEIAEWKRANGRCYFRKENKTRDQASQRNVRTFYKKCTELT